MRSRLSRTRWARSTARGARVTSRRCRIVTAAHRGSRGRLDGEREEDGGRATSAPAQERAPPREARDQQALRGLVRSLPARVHPSPPALFFFRRSVRHVPWCPGALEAGVLPPELGDEGAVSPATEIESEALEDRAKKPRSKCCAVRARVFASFPGRSSYPADGATLPRSRAGRG